MISMIVTEARELPRAAAPGEVLRDFKDTVYPFFQSDTLFLECCVVLCLAVSRFFESRDV